MSETSLSREAIELLEFSLGPKAKRARGDSKADRASSKLAKGAVGAAAMPAAALWSIFGNGSHQSRSAKAKAALARTITKAPEAMVKVTGRQNGRSHVAANFTYIARIGWGEDKELALLTSEGQTMTTLAEMNELAGQWHAWELQDDTRRKGATSLSFILSMPEGTEPDRLQAAARAFAEDEMEGRRWVMGLHTDRDHPHVHLTVARRDLDGRRFHPGKEDLFRYRLKFAEKLRAHGIEANATPRKARGLTRKALKTPIVQMTKRGEDSRYAKRLQREAAMAAKSGKATTAFDAEIRQQRIDVLEGYLRAGKELLESTDPKDRELAAGLGGYIQKLPLIQTRAAQGLEIHKHHQQRQISSDRELKEIRSNKVDGPKR
jgi:Relaxase/Mobilisation nuclease domain